MNWKDTIGEMERDGQATLLRAIEHGGATDIDAMITAGGELALAVEVEEEDGRRWTHRYSPDEDGWPNTTRPAHARVRSITVRLEADGARTEIATDLAIIEGSFACCDDAMIIVTQGTTLTTETLARVLDNAYGTLFARERTALDIETRERERTQEHRTGHRNIAALTAAQALAQSPEQARTERIRLLWEQCIDLPKGTAEKGVYTVTVNAQTTHVEHRA